MIRETRLVGFVILLVVIFLGPGAPDLPPLGTVTIDAPVTGPGTP